jgi:hypothetical protein
MKLVLSFLFLFNIAYADDLVSKINREVDRLQAMIGKTKVRRKVQGGMHAADVEYIDGVPKNTKVIVVNSKMIFRHYSPDYAQAIVESKKLIAGPRPFILPESHLKQQFDDLTGVFMTRPEDDPHRLWLGYTRQTPHVDFKLPLGLKVLDLGDGNFLVPGAPKLMDWIVKEYERYRESGKIPSGMEDSFLLIDRRGGAHPPLEIPIEIVSGK